MLVDLLFVFDDQLSIYLSLIHASSVGTVFVGFGDPRSNPSLYLRKINKAGIILSNAI